MSSLFRSLNNFSHKREIVVKECIINTLRENAKEIQYEFKENGRDYLESTEATNSLCITLEALFLHGLKDSFLWQTISVISNDVDHRPEPSFWLPLMVFLHKQVIEQIHTFNQISSEIGYCRSWIRLSLNESILSSYLNNIRKDSSALNPYYKKYALLKDVDTIEMAAKILEGIESCVQINLPLNSSLFNKWPDYSLQLAGIWAPPLKSCPISSGVDVASAITEDVTIPTPKPVSTTELFSESISNSPFSQTNNFGHQDLTHQENVKLFLQKLEEKNEASEEDESEVVETDGGEGGEDEISSPTKEDDDRPNKGNSLNNFMNGSWSSADPHQDNSANTNQILMRTDSMSSSISSIHGPANRYSYHTLLRKHEHNRQVDWTDVWKLLESNLYRSGDRGSQILTARTESSVGSFDFELVSAQPETFSAMERQDMVQQMCKIANEVGLDAQGFVCKSCSHPLGMDFAIAQVCKFTGNYFCNSCMSVELVLIPAKVIFNWDFRKYPVSKRAALFLQEFQYHPFIDLKNLNPNIYNSIEKMAILQSLRIRLNFIRAYLYTCCATSIQGLEKLVYAKEYLFEHIHTYSIADLNTIPKGSLFSLLQKTVNYGEQHILNCALCSWKGFICEICNSPKVLYPFHIDTTYRCSICGAVFHPNCLNESDPCPKCERRRKREDLPLLDAVPML